MRYLLLLIIVIFLSCNEEQAAAFPEINVTDIDISEGESQKLIFVTITLSFPAVEPITVLASSSDISATSGEDYEQIENVSIQFDPGEQTKSLKVTILGDDQFEQNEQFLIELSVNENTSNSSASGIVTLINDDSDDNFIIPPTGYTTPESYPGMNLYWQDEFNNDEINTLDWTFEFGGSGWGNNELQYYTDNNALLYEGNLVIEARQEPFGGRQYTSTRMITMNKMEFQYGRVDIRAVLPYGQGIWPALWMLGANFPDVGWPYCGEIDIMEMIGGNGRENTVHGTAHWQGVNGRELNGHDYTLNSGIFNNEFHVFSIVWNASSIKWYVDDNLYHTMNTTNETRTEFQEAFFFIFNIAVGGDWPGSPDLNTVFPQRMIVDYVRVFQNQ